MKSHTLRTLIIAALVLAVVPKAGLTQKFASDPPFKIKIDFDRWHDTAEVYADMRRMEQACVKLDHGARAALQSVRSAGVGIYRVTPGTPLPVCF